MNIYNIDKNILIKSSYEAVVAFLEKKYKDMGYETVREYPLDKFKVDGFRDGLEGFAKDADNRF
jgi:hypothetical protein